MADALAQIVNSFMGDLSFFKSTRSLSHPLDTDYRVASYSFDTNSTEEHEVLSVPEEFERNFVHLHPILNFGISGYAMEFASVDVANNVTLNFGALMAPGMKVDEVKNVQIINRSLLDQDSIMNYLDLRYNGIEVSEETRSLKIYSDLVDVLVYVPSRNSTMQEVEEELKVIQEFLQYLMPEGTLCIKVPGASLSLFPLFTMFEEVTPCIPFSSGSSGIWFVLKSLKKTWIPTDTKVTREFLDFMNKVAEVFYEDSQLRIEAMTMMPMIIDPIRLSYALKLKLN